MSKQDGKVIAGPDIISRGFVYVRESEDLMEESRKVVRDVLTECEKRHITDWATKINIRDALRGFYMKNKEKSNDTTYNYGSIKYSPSLFLSWDYIMFLLLFNGHY